MILAAHQPNFFPWLGYFNKIHRSDVFVLLDDVQMVKTGSTWFNRTYLLINKEARFITVPVARPSGTVSIKDSLVLDFKWKKRVLSSLESSYGRHPYFKNYIPDISLLVENSSESLCSFNLNAIYHFIDLFEMDKSKLVLSSTLNVQSSSTRRLIDLTKATGCDSYLEGGGATGYQEDSLFQAEGVSLVKQNFVHPKYPQKGSDQFVMGLSVLDALFNCGIDETKKLIMAGVL